MQKSKYKTTIFLFLGILINICGSLIAENFNLNIYLDSIGTIFVSSVCGYAGILVGLFTNLIKCIWDPTSIYYLGINVMIAAITAFIVKKTRHPFVFLLLSLSVTGGILGHIFTAAIYDVDFSSSVSNAFLYDFIDKLISITFVFLAIRFFHIPISVGGRSKNSVRTRILFITFLSLLFLSVIQMGISVNLYQQTSIKTEQDTAGSVCNLMKNIIEGNINDFIKNDDSNEYRTAKKQLEELRTMFPNIKYMYIYQILEDGCHVVFDLDTKDTKASAHGTVIPFDESFSEKIDNLLKGEEIEPIITDDTFGHLLTVYKPVGPCYAGVDIEMDYFKNNTLQYLIRMLSLFIGFSISILYLLAWYMEQRIFTPIFSIASVASHFVVKTDEDRRKSMQKISALKIHTNDEIEVLYDSISKMSNKSIEYMEQIQAQKEALTKMQDGLITVLADVVESRDACTGTHIKNTATYVRLMLEEMKKGGKYSEYMTDEYIANVESSAPLHDVGKIHTPDAILNKPGRLSENEYNIMKEHSLNGNHIIEEAIELVPDPMFLSEAQNMALYHHEKWDGSGYPCGLKGEEIPLSARIMAVADVYDALTSKRSYKEGMPKEKALAIIKDGAGTHFDPYIVDVFVEVIQAHEPRGTVG